MRRAKLGRGCASLALILTLSACARPAGTTSALTPSTGEQPTLSGVASASLPAESAGVTVSEPLQSSVASAVDSTHLQPTPAHYDGPITAVEDFSSLGILLRPPGTASPKLGWQAAYAKCATQGCITYGENTEVVLALATTTASGTAGPGGTIVPRTNQALSYVLIARNAECPLPAGGVSRPGETTAVERPTRSCTFVQLIDADSGQVGYAASGQITP
jgi:hypothetical protein